jgi:hypothetical protein
MREVASERGHWVIRAERVGWPSDRSNWGMTVMLWRRLRGERRWHLTVRTWQNDRLGKPVHSETVNSRAAVHEAADRLDKDLREGRVP